MAVAFSGALSGTMAEVIVPSRASESSPVCAGTISSDAAGENCLFKGGVGSDVPSLSFASPRTQAPGSYAGGT